MLLQLEYTAGEGQQCSQNLVVCNHLGCTIIVMMVVVLSLYEEAKATRLAAATSVPGCFRNTQPLPPPPTHTHTPQPKMLRLPAATASDAGVWRSHASCLQLPLQHPVNLTATALQLPSGAVALSITLSLEPGLKTAFVLHQAGLRPQFGLLLGPEFSSSSSSGVLGAGASSSSSGGAERDSRVGFREAVPLLLVPGGTAGLSFLLLPDPGNHSIANQPDAKTLLVLTAAANTHCIRCCSFASPPSYFLLSPDQ
jgi:hypothetical protein